MRVLMLTWEYPPMRVGGIAAALEGLSPALARQGIEVHVVTCGAAGGEADEKQAENLFIHRVTVDEPSKDFIHWVHLLNDNMEARAALLLDDWAADAAKPRKKKIPTLLHSHDWLGLFSGRALKRRYRLPFISTIHATEFGRNDGIHTEMQKYINKCEWDLQWESWRVIVCSAFMRGEVEYALKTPFEKIDVIYNGVETGGFDFPFAGAERQGFRDRFAAPNEKIVFFIGRMVREKGAQMLIEALPRLRFQYHDAKLVIAGGGDRTHLENLARYTGMIRHVYFTGRVSDADRDKLYRVADVAVYPSLYEPFGIVALEAMAAKVPVVVSNAGGLPEVVQHDVTGTLTYNGDPDSLAWGVARALKNPDFARRMADAAFERVQKTFNWNVIAEQTKAVYARVWEEYKANEFSEGVNWK